MPRDQKAVERLCLIAVGSLGPDFQNELLSQAAESCRKPADLSVGRVLNRVGVLGAA